MAQKKKSENCNIPKAMQDMMNMMHKSKQHMMKNGMMKGGSIKPTMRKGGNRGS